MYVHLLSEVIQKKKTAVNAIEILNEVSDGFNQNAVNTTRKSEQTEIIKEDDILSAVIDPCPNFLQYQSCGLKMVSVSYKDGKGVVSQNKHYIYLFDKLNKIDYGTNHVEPLRII